MTTIISFAIVIGIIVFVHELGHFLAAKLSGVRVEEFSLGFPPKLVSWKRGETEYQLAWIPLGGYVKMSGMLDESFDKDYDKGDPRGFMAQAFHKKVFIITAGVIMNVILAFFIYSALTWNEGVAELVGTKVSHVAENYPAAKAGIQVGDKITYIAGKEINEWRQLTEVVREYPDIAIPITWLREGVQFDTMITPQGSKEFNLDKGQTEVVGKIGVVGEYIIKPVGPIQAFGYGAMQVWGVIHLNIISIKALLTGGAGISELTGPLGIARLSGESAKSGMSNFLSFIALISVSIAFLNILPIPMLDGGHLVFIVIEALIRRPIPDKIKIGLIRVGLAALLLLVVVVSYHDIMRFFE